MDFCKNEMKKIIVKTILAWVIVSMCIFFFMQDKFLLFFGLCIGLLIGIFKFHSMSKYLQSALMQENNNEPKLVLVFNYVLGWVSVISFLIITIILNQVVFWGGLIGLLLITFVIFINGITKGLCTMIYGNFE